MQWGFKHMPEMRIAKAAGLLGPENTDWRNVAEHLLVVNAVANFIARRLVEPNMEIDLKTIDQASILHDVTKRLEKEQGISYGNEHGSSIRHDFLASFGYSDEVIDMTEFTGRVPEMFISDERTQIAHIAALPLGKLIVAYADARVRNSDVVSLAEARDLNKHKVPGDTTVYDEWFDFYRNVEDRIFREIHDPTFTPESITNDSVAQMVAAIEVF